MATNITKEEDNFLRIVYLNYRVGTTALRRFLTMFILICHQICHLQQIYQYFQSYTNHQKDKGEYCTRSSGIYYILLQAIIGLGNQHDVKDAAEAKSKSLDYNSLQELVHIDTRLNYHTNEIAKQTSKIEKLETTVEVMGKGNIYKIYKSTSVKYIKRIQMKGKSQAKRIAWIEIETGCV
ncbi:unnamed protein product [Mytilus edulis]|uniref:Uncharacterized protein n=1 Tax=Mytilus edulis TaxID=6550 RepID=A0A8S3SP45_MYTED|nr:unnamed protein product [Mytilus edulis]